MVLLRKVWVQGLAAERAAVRRCLELLEGSLGVLFPAAAEIFPVEVRVLMVLPSVPAQVFLPVLSFLSRVLAQVRAEVPRAGPSAALRLLSAGRRLR